MPAVPTNAPPARLLLPLAALAVAAAVALLGGGPVSGAVGMLLVWVAALAALLLAPRDVAFTVGVGIGAHATALMVASANVGVALPWWVATASTAVAAALAVRHARGATGASEADAVTGLPGPDAWDAAVARELERARREGYAVSVAMIELHGDRPRGRAARKAAARDTLEVAAAWSANLRRSDLLSRYGRDRFAVLFSATRLAEAEEAVERLRQAAPRRVSFGAGVTAWDGREQAGTLIRRAEQGAARARQDGPDRTVALPTLAS